MGRPNSRKKVIETAIQVFLRDGYAASLDTVAAEANVTRKTLYNLFDSKEGLFRAVIAEMCEQWIDPVVKIRRDGSLYDVLMEVGTHHLNMICDSTTRAILRLGMSIGPQFPDLANFIVDVGVGREVQALSIYLREMVDKDQITCADTDMAAERFFGSLMGFSLLRGLMGMEAYPQQKVPLVCKQAVDSFIENLRPSSPDAVVRIVSTDRFDKAPQSKTGRARK